MSKFRCYCLLGRLCATQAFDGGLLNVLGGYALRLLRLIILLMVWRSILTGRADAGMSLQQVLTYTLISSVFAEQMDIVTPATMAFWEGSIIGRYTRPMPVIAQLMAETMGRWIPALLMYSLPMLLIAPLLGVSPWPASPVHGLAFAASMVLAVSLGFAMDFMYAALSVRIKNASWMAYTIRKAVVSVFSGVLIPFALLPWGLGDWLALLPFGSLANGPLTIFVGEGPLWSPLLSQIFWNAVLWPLALLAVKKSQERMVSYGG